MTDPIRIHGYLLSTFTRTAVMACIEKGLAYELVPVRRGSDEHAAMHPFTRMPVFEHGGVVLFETLAITSYIDEAFDGPPLQPTGQPDRARMLQWLGLCSDYVFKDVVRGLPRKRAATDDERAAARRVLERIDARVGSPFLLGDAISLADLYLAPQISNAREKLPELLVPLTATQAWIAGIEERASFTRTAYAA